MRIIIGTRGSKLALVQSNAIAELLRAAGARVELKTIKTTGDKLVVELADVGGKGLFVKEIEEALLGGSVDLAVHSMKDMPAVLPEGLAIVSIPKREDPRDVMISEKASSIDDLPKGARIGTSSPRRAAQLKRIRPDLEVLPMRGNVETRIRKLKDGEADAIILAAAGLNRLGMSAVVTEYIPIDRMIPAVGQGALALEARAGDRELIEFVAGVSYDRATVTAVAAERALLDAVGGDCHTPVAAHARVESDGLVLDAYLADEEGTKHAVDYESGPAGEAGEIGRRLGERLLKKVSDT